MQEKLQEGTTDMAEVYGDPTMEMASHKVMLEETFIKSRFVLGLVEVGWPPLEAAHMLLQSLPLSRPRFPFTYLS